MDWEAYLDGVAPAVGLAVNPCWRSDIVRFLAVAAEMAATLEVVDLADDDLNLDAVLVLPEAP